MQHVFEVITRQSRSVPSTTGAPRPVPNLGGTARRFRGVLFSWGLAAIFVACADDGARPTPPLPVTIVSPSPLPDASLGSSYDVTLIATGPTGPIMWSLNSGALPAGVELRAEGRLTGTPSDTGTASFSLRAQSGAASATAPFLLRVTRPPLFITTSTLADAELGQSYSTFLAVDGGQGPATWSLASGALPSGLTLTPGGVIVGNASALGSFTFAVRAVRGSLTAERALSLQVVPPPLTITTDTLPDAKAGELYSVQLQRSGGVSVAMWSVSQGALPAGLALSGSGVISGTPATAGSASFDVRVVSGAATVDRTLTLNVLPAGFPSAVTVTMPGNIFVPFVVELKQGGTVTWRFGSVPHNVIFSTAGAPADINIVSNVDVTRTFPTVGFFRYDCTIHPGMAGIVDVKP